MELSLPLLWHCIACISQRWVVICDEAALEEIKAFYFFLFWGGCFVFWCVVWFLFYFWVLSCFFKLLLLIFLSAETGQQLVRTGTSPLLLDWKLTASRREKNKSTFCCTVGSCSQVWSTPLLWHAAPPHPRVSAVIWPPVRFLSRWAPCHLLTFDIYSIQVQLCNCHMSRVDDKQTGSLLWKSEPPLGATEQ